MATEGVKLAIDNASLKKFNKLNVARFFEAGKEFARDFKLIDEIKASVIKYICAKEPKGCATLTNFDTNIAKAMEKQMEKQMEPLAKSRIVSLLPQFSS